MMNTRVTGSKIKVSIIMALLHMSMSNFCLYGQTQVVNGRVLDELDQPLPGVSISLVGKSSGTISDFDGEFAISLASGDTLNFSFISYEPYTLVYSGQSYLNVQMQPVVQSLEEVVVIGYGSIKKQDLTGAVGIIKAEDLMKIPASNVALAMQGRTSGVQIINAAEPGLNPTILVRGYGTIYGDPNPLVVIDGIQTTTGALTNLNPADIATMQILKDASAAAIYGSRAANGVIIITTKTGNKERMEISYSSELGLQQAANRFDMMNTEQYAEYTRRLYVNSSTQFNPVSPPIWTNNEQVLSNYTDWQDVAFRNAMLQNHNLSIQGGSKNSSFFMGFGYLKQEGVIVNTDFERYNFRINSNYNYGRLRIGQAFNMYYRHKPENDLARRPEHIYAVAPQIPVFDETNLNGLGAPLPAWTGGNNLPNPLAYDYRSYVTNSFGAQGNIFAELDILEGLSFRSELNLTFNNNAFERYYEPIDQSQAAISTNSYQIDVRNNSSTSINSENYFKYKNTVGGHRFDLIAGWTAIKTNFVGTVATGSDLEPGTRVPQTGSSTRGSAANEQTALLSQLARINYAFLDRYLLTASLRRDGASNFAPKNRWGYFPSFSAGWLLSEERFFKRQDWLYLLKVRAGYGELGRNLGTFQNTLNSEIRYPWMTGDISGVAPINIPNEDLRWERVKQINIGLDVEFFKGKIKLSADYFSRISEDMIIQIPLPQFTGVPAATWANIGSMSNNGVELELNYVLGAKKDFYHSVGFNVTFIRNMVISLSDNQDTILTNNTLTTPGFPVASHYGWIVEGVNPVNGQLEFVDLNGSGNVTGRDRMILGSPHADGFFGINYSANYKGWDIAVFFQGVWGNYILNGSRRSLQSTHLDRNRLASVLNDAWDPESNPNGTLPIISLSNRNDNDRPADRWIEKGDYIRLRNLQIGYKFSPQVLQKLNLTNCRLYLNAINIWTWTTYTGLDPDISPLESVFNLGQDNFRYPPIRSFNFGIQIGL